MKRIRFVNGTKPALNASNLNLLQQNIEEAIQEVMEKQHPVNSVYITLDGVNPSIILGYGTWEQIKGRFLLGCGDNGDGIDYIAGSISGNTTHKHTTKDHQLTVDEMPSHAHNFRGVNDGTGATPSYGSYPAKIYQDTAPNWTGYFISNTGGNQAHNHGDTGETNNMPPYLAVYIWKRIA